MDGSTTARTDVVKHGPQSNDAFLRGMIPDTFLIVALGFIALVAIAGLVLWSRRRHASRARYTTPLPTWGEQYRNALADQVRRPRRIQARERDNADEYTYRGDTPYEEQGFGQSDGKQNNSEE